MSITTYAELQTAVQTWLDRTDISASAPDFITLAEGYFQRKLRVRQMVTTSTFTTSGGSASLPSDFLGVVAVLHLSSNPIELDGLEQADFQTRFGSLSSGTPEAYMIQGSTIYIAPVDDTASSKKLVYYQKIPVLSVSNTTNWLLTAYPDLYLAGSLAEAELFDKGVQMGALWKQRRDEICDELEKSEAFNYRGPSPQMRFQNSTLP